MNTRSLAAIIRGTSSFSTCSNEAVNAVGDCPRFRPAKMGPSPCDARYGNLARLRAAPAKPVAHKRSNQAHGSYFGRRGSQQPMTASSRLS